MVSAPESYQPARLFVRAGSAATAGFVICLLCSLGSRFALIPTALCLLTAFGCFWLAKRPTVRVSPTQLTVGERAIAWREIREINGVLDSPLIVRLKLTNNRRKLLVCPATPERLARLSYMLRKHSYLATFDGISYRDYWTWFSVLGSKEDKPVSEHPIRMVSHQDEVEIERLFRKLKSMRSEDAHSSDDSTTRRED